MRNRILSAFLFSILALLIFNSCKKENIDMTEMTPDEIIPDTIVCDLSAEIFSFPEQEPPILEVTANGGSGELSYLWSEGSTTEQIVQPVDSTYSVTVTDELGCSAESTFNYNPPIDNCDLFGVDIIYIDSVSLLLTAITSGIAPYNYNWSEGSTTDQISISPPGTFSVTVIDANGCTAENEIIL